MSFYKLESTFKTISIRRSKNKRTYSYWCPNEDSMLLRLREDLSSGAKVAVRSISEHEYMKGIEA
jgi:hypothetical protein